MRVWNPTEEKVSTLIQGSWFTFAPGGFKTMDEHKARFIETNRKETGLVVLDNRFDPSSEQYEEGFDKSQEGKDLLEHKKNEGISNLIAFHMDIIRNNQVSLKQDLAHKYPTGDAAKLSAIYASKGELESMKLVKKYQAKNPDNEAKRVEEVAALMAEIGTFTE